MSKLEAAIYGKDIETLTNITVDDVSIAIRAGYMSTIIRKIYI